MLIEHTAVLARVLGVALNLVMTYVTAIHAIWICAGSEQAPVWLVAILLALLGLVTWAVTSIGDWLWSLEEGWFELQRLLRVIQTAFIVGGFFTSLVLKAVYSFMGF
ncbi:hypothetical protein WJU23_14795 [Prosthecobacter sp. SYSU 5D2]|uniref:hypothetical protein n=1 Tax=Prosthecobacter sp. SYSU 5D2 TaxID=3134134 RepID=UPI0031FF3643